jgi:hypothetical protein
MKGVLPLWFVGLVVPVQKICILPWLFQSAQYKIFCSLRTLYHFVPIVQQPGQEVVLGACLLICVFGLFLTRNSGQQEMTISLRKRSLIKKSLVFLYSQNVIGVKDC